MVNANKLLLQFLLLFGLNQIAAQNLPRIGSDTILEVANWNIEWFGDTQNGPSDETTQFNNVKKVLEQTDLDIWGLAEMSNTATFSSLLSQLSNTYNAVNSTFSATQKMCLFYKKSMFNLIPSLTFNIPVNSTHNFASRPPLQVALQTVGGNKTDTLYFLVVHLKAFSDADSYNRRVAASAYLKTYMEQTLAKCKVFIIGDWNDMLNKSTYNNSVSPFKNFLDAGYLFTTKALEDAGKPSYVSLSNSFIDHQLISKNLDSFYYSQSSVVYNNIGSIINNFSNNTSDHYPVYSKFNWKKLTVLPAPDTTTTAVNNISGFKSGNSVYPNPANTSLTMDVADWVQDIKLYNTTGQMVMNVPMGLTLDIGELKPGIYYLHFNNTAFKQVLKLIKL